MSFNRRESAEWALAVDAEAGKLQAGVDKALADGAARGFSSPPGDTLGDILAMGQEVKGKLVEADGKIYDTRRGVLFQQQEFALGILVKLAKFGLELYRSDIFNALELEQAQQQAVMARSHADVERLNTETELRQRAIIQNRAEMERRIIIYKQQLVAAETTTLGAEAILIQATLSTAEKKLEIIASIYQVLAAEELVLAAENRRAASLTKVLTAELIVAGIKKEMVPFFLQKAGAEEQLAQAITQNLPIEEALIRLGYDRLDLKTTEEYAGHLEREQQEELELLREDFVRASTATELAKMQNRRLLTEYRNLIQTRIAEQKKALQKDEVAFRLLTRLERETIGVNNEVTVTQHEISNLTQELISLLDNMVLRAQDQADTVKASATQVLLHADTTDTQSVVRKIIAG
jgi:hypothetical protein